MQTLRSKAESADVKESKNLRINDFGTKWEEPN